MPVVSSSPARAAHALQAISTQRHRTRYSGETGGNWQLDRLPHGEWRVTPSAGFGSMETGGRTPASPFTSGLEFEATAGIGFWQASVSRLEPGRCGSERFP
jgi:hypothetical protein